METNKHRSQAEIIKDTLELLRDKPKPKEKAKTFNSNARWSEIPNSSDSHNIKDTSWENFDYAQTICQLLMDRWGPGERPCEVRGTCLETWVTDENGKRVEHRE